MGTGKSRQSSHQLLYQSAACEAYQSTCQSVAWAANSWPRLRSSEKGWRSSRLRHVRLIKEVSAVGPSPFNHDRLSGQSKKGGEALDFATSYRSKRYRPQPIPFLRPQLRSIRFVSAPPSPYQDRSCGQLIYSRLCRVLIKTGKPV